MEDNKQVIPFGENQGITSIEIATATGRKSGYHAKAKIISEKLTSKVLQQQGFLTGFTVNGPMANVDSDSLGNVMDQFLNQKFFNLKDLGINIAHDQIVNDEANIIHELIEESKRNNLGGQALSINDEFQSLNATKSIFQFAKKCAENNQFDERHIMLLTSVNEICDNLRTDQKAFTLSSLAEICQWNDLAGRYRVPMAINTKYLVEIFTACPVWYVEGETFVRTLDDGDPKPDEFTKHICKLIGTQNFANFFQMYNRRTRSFNDFKGPDIMPPHIVKALPKLKETFDYLVIATPYHDQASQEWANPAWISSIDPYLIGFKKEMPGYAVLIDRWSGTGLLPLMVDMIADTMDHLQKHLGLLRNFATNTYWYGVGLNKDDSLLGEELPNFGSKILEKFNSDELFTFLRSK